MTNQWAITIASLFAQARADLADGRLTAQRLDEIERRLLVADKTRQRLLYLHAGSPSIRSTVIAAALHEPVPGSVTQVDPLAADPPYTSVHEAMLVVHQGRNSA